MEYNSYFFIFVCLPLFPILYFWTARIGKGKIDLNKLFLIVCGVVFYYSSGFVSIVVLGIGIGSNYIFACIIRKMNNKRKFFLTITVLINACLLLFFKYTNFAISTVNKVAEKDYTLLNIVLPAGISFFTFQQIMYLVSVYNGKIEKVNVVDYLAYILFFPKLLMGPLIEPVDLITQLNDRSRRSVNWDNIASGIRLFSYGLFKKLVLADTFGKAVSWTFRNVNKATSGDILLTMVLYSFQIYFDFSGYIDMSVGIARMINIDLPINFKSPYKAFSVSDFWKRWHMSLTRFFTNYIYIPLGGNRKGKTRTYINIMIVFLVSGIWHGANWTFILWGGIYGLVLIAERVLKKSYGEVNVVVQWMYTFSVVSILWLLFRSDSVTQWALMIKKMFSFESLDISQELITIFALPESSFLYDILHMNWLNNAVRGYSCLLFIVAGFTICLIPSDNYEGTKKNTFVNILMASVALVWAVLCLGTVTTFVYSGF